MLPAASRSTASALACVNEVGATLCVGCALALLLEFDVEVVELDCDFVLHGSVETRGAHALIENESTESDAPSLKNGVNNGVNNVLNVLRRVMRICASGKSK